MKKVIKWIKDKFRFKPVHAYRQPRFDHDSVVAYYTGGKYKNV